MEGEIRFTIHARKRMRDRNVSEAEVMEALMNIVRERRAGDAIIRFGITADGRRLKVVQPIDDLRFVVTVGD